MDSRLCFNVCAMASRTPYPHPHHVPVFYPTHRCRGPQVGVSPAPPPAEGVAEPTRNASQGFRGLGGHDLVQDHGGHLAWAQGQSSPYLQACAAQAGSSKQGGGLQVPPPDPQRTKGAGPAFPTPPMRAGWEDAGDEASSSSDEEGPITPGVDFGPSAEAPQQSSQRWSELLSSSSTHGGVARAALRRWKGHPESSPFAPMRPDPCLYAPFDAFKKKSKPLYNAFSEGMTSSGAAANAILSAQAALVDIRHQLRRSLVDDLGAEWQEFVEFFDGRLSEEVERPLEDAVKISASSFSHSASGIRNGVIDAAQSEIQPTLRATPPANHFFFGNPTKVLASSMNYAVMAATLAQKKRPPAPRSAPKPPPAPRQAASRSSSSSHRGKASGRPSRGGKGGQKK